MRTNADGTHDYPFEDVVREVEGKLKKDPTIRFFQKFTCAKCGNRLTMSEPNKFYETGGCDKCGYVTDIQARGCNHLMVLTPDPKNLAQFDSLVKKINEEDK